MWWESESRFRKKSGKQPKTPKIKSVTSGIHPVVIGRKYCIDQLEIVSKVDPVLLNAEIHDKMRPISRQVLWYSVTLDLKQEKEKKNKDAKRKKYKEAYKQGFRSIFRMTCPTTEFFDLLFANESIFGVYKPWVIELCKELELASDREAIFLADKYIDTAYKRNSTHTFIYDSWKSKIQKNRTEPEFETEFEHEQWIEEQELRRRVAEGVIGHRTLYLGESDFCFVVYARKSKVTDKPCVHMEWRLLWSSNYKRFIQWGIVKENGSYFLGLKKLTEFEFVNKWEGFTNGHIKHSEINEIAVAKQLKDRVISADGFKNMANNWRPKKRLSDKEVRALSLEYAHFANQHEIESTSQFVSYWRQYRNTVENDAAGGAIPHYSDFLEDIGFMYEDNPSLLGGARVKRSHKIERRNCPIKPGKQNQ